jgi:hypothetical protein
MCFVAVKPKQVSLWLRLDSLRIVLDFYVKTFFTNDAKSLFGGLRGPRLLHSKSWSASGGCLSKSYLILHHNIYHRRTYFLNTENLRRKTR